MQIDNLGDFIQIICFVSLSVCLFILFLALKDVIRLPPNTPHED